MDPLKEKKNTGKNTGIENLIPFKKGESGNPNGRPLGTRNFKTLYMEAIEKIATATGKDPDELEIEIVRTGVTKARNGDYAFYRDLQDRLHGRPVAPVDITSKGEKIITNPELVAIAKKFEEELKGKL